MVGVLIVSGHAAVLEIAVSQSVIGAASGFFNPASTACVAALRRPCARGRLPALRTDVRGSFIGDLRDGFAELSSRTWLWATMIVMAISNALAGAFFVLGPVIAKRHLGGPGAWAATVLQQNIPTDTLSRVTSFEWFGTLALMPIGFAVAGPVGAALGYGTTLYLCGGLSLLISIGLIAVPSVRTLEVRHGSVGGR